MSSPCGSNRLDGMSADVVVGAGVIGSSIARELVRSGHRVVVVDKAGAGGARLQERVERGRAVQLLHPRRCRDGVLLLAALG
jgi:glycine/D-amino acid oxidase-like deaminating enzyme